MKHNLKLYSLILFFLCISRGLSEETWTYHNSEIGFDNAMQCMVEDEQGTIWIGSVKKGIYKYDGSTYSKLTEDGLEILGIASYQNFIYAATNAGLLKLNKTDNSYELIKYSDDVFYNVFGSVAVDKNGIVWVGGGWSEGSILLTYDGEWHEITEVNSNMKSGIESILIDENQNIHISTINSIAQRIDGEWKIYTKNEETLLQYGITDIALDKNNHLTVSLWGVGSILSFDGTDWNVFNDNLFSSTYQTCLAYDKDGALWVGTQLNGAFKYDGSTWTQYVQENSELKAHTILAMYVDSKNQKWFSTMGNGIAIYNDGKTAVETEYLQDQFTLFPNPASSIINIANNSELNGNSKLSLFNISGDNLFSETISLDNLHSLDLSNYPSGKYFLKVQNEDKFKVLDFVIER